MNGRYGKWANQIINSQNPDGTWGLSFHSMAYPVKKYPLTTEQALRRLLVLGFTSDYEPVRRTYDYMTSCLRGERKMDNSWEKTHDWALFTKLMLSAWIKILDDDNELAADFANRWARVIEKAFETGAYDQTSYVSAYINEFSRRPNGSRELDPTSFYHVTLLRGVLPESTERKFLEYVTDKPDGIYYIHTKRIKTPPETFAGRESSRYLAALEILSQYKTAGEKLSFTKDWLMANKDAEGQWDFGAKANDGLYFPVSDSWKKTKTRKTDCSNRVTAYLRSLER